MDILTISAEIIQAIVDIIKWLTKKGTPRKKIASQRTENAEWDNPSSLLAIMLKPVEPFLMLFTNHAIILLALFAVGGAMVKLNLDVRIGVFFIGLIFALAGTGNFVTTQKDAEDVSCTHYLLYAMSAFIILFGALIIIAALLAIIIGVPVNPSGM